MEKVQNLVRETGHSSLLNSSTERLGQESDDQEKPRPILAKLDNEETQKNY